MLLQRIMAKGVSIKFQSYEFSVPKILDIIKLGDELKKHNTIVLKPSLRNIESLNTEAEFTEAVLRYCLENKRPEAKILIAEGSDGADTEEVFEKTGYRSLAERYGVGLVDLNTAEVEEIMDGEFLKFDKIMYPKILLENFVISLPRLSDDSELEISGALANMLGAFPSAYYQGIFSKKKNKIRKWHMKFSIHDILKCKMPDLAVIDASEQGSILAGVPLDMDFQSAKLLGKDAKAIQHLRLISQSFPEKPLKEEKTQLPESKVQ
jgi:uncharacterized protein (DUF362 family)